MKVASVAVRDQNTEHSSIPSSVLSSTYLGIHPKIPPPTFIPSTQRSLPWYTGMDGGGERSPPPPRHPQPPGSTPASSQSLAPDRAFLTPYALWPWGLSFWGFLYFSFRVYCMPCLVFAVPGAGTRRGGTLSGTSHRAGKAGGHMPGVLEHAMTMTSRECLEKH